MCRGYGFVLKGDTTCGWGRGWDGAERRASAQGAAACGKPRWERRILLLFHHKCIFAMETIPCSAPIIPPVVRPYNTLDGTTKCSRAVVETAASAKGSEDMRVRSCGRGTGLDFLLNLTRGETWGDAVLSAAKARSRARARPKRKWKGTGFQRKALLLAASRVFSTKCSGDKREVDGRWRGQGFARQVASCEAS